MNQQVLTNGIIEAYRELIKERYRYENIIKNYDIPDSFDSSKMTLFRTYFLEYIYPPSSTREELNDAFESLTHHVSHPTQIMRILLDSGGLVFKFGWHLPKILKAGLKALRSYKAATQLENNLVSAAMRLTLHPPFSSSELKELIRTIPPVVIDEFIEDTLVLFETLHDRKLVKKIIEIVNKLINKMTKNTELYGVNEVKGLILGRDIITHGDALFEQLTPEEQNYLFDWVARIERESIHEILEKK